MASDMRLSWHAAAAACLSHGEGMLLWTDGILRTLVETGADSFSYASHVGQPNELKTPALVRSLRGVGEGELLFLCAVAGYAKRCP